MKYKFFADHNSAAEKLYHDVGANNIKVYTVAEYERIAQILVHPNVYTEKWSQVSVAISGEAPTGHDCPTRHDWMVVAPYRVDELKKTGEKCIDIDPVLFFFDSNTGSPHPSGVVAYHQNFSGRTTPYPGYETANLDAAVADLRMKITTELEPLESAPTEVLSALHHMVGKFRTDFLGGKDGE